MSLPIRTSLTGRLLLGIGFATILPLTVLMALVMLEAYQISADQGFDTIAQTGHRYAADIDARLNEKLGLLEALASVNRTLDDGPLPDSILGANKDLRAGWILREGRPDTGEPGLFRELYKAVRERGTEVLSAPDIGRNEASLGYPILEKGQFVGMVAVTFSLGDIQKTVTDIRLFQSGYALLVAHDGTRIAHPDPSLVGTKIGNDVDAGMAAEMLNRVTQGIEFSFEKKALLTGKWSRQFYSPVTAGRAWDPWFLVMVAPAEEVNKALDVLFSLLILGALGTLALVATTTWLATRSVVRPLRLLTRGAEQIADGHLDTRVQITTRDELGTLGEAFNRMADQLALTLQTQEETVRERTDSLRRSLVELEQAQAKIVDTEKMAVLGQLTATIAHEINTPLGAIRSSATFLHQNTSGRYGDLPGFFRHLDPATLSWYKNLVLQKGGALKASAGGEDRRRRRALAQRLRALGTDDPDGLADDIVFLVPPQEDEAMVAAAAAGKGPVIRHAAETGAMIQSSSIILEAADRAAATVAALVDYSRSQDVRNNQSVDPAKELETLMTLYYGIAKRGVEVIRDYEPGLAVLGDRDKLNQVWVNLINNALQAMEYRGKLVLRTKKTPHGVEIAVGNNGPPVPEDLREKIFQPFFTTKKAGEGTGLGLDICRRIVEAHHGSLVHSQEGAYTVFTVRLPSPAEAERSPS